MIITPKRRECSTSTGMLPSLSANPSGTEPILQTTLVSVNKTIKPEPGCVSAEGSGICRAEHICMALDETL